MTTTRRKTRRTRTPEPVRFPNSVLFYLQIALEGPLGPGGIAHRIKTYPTWTIGRYSHRTRSELIGPACGATTTRPGLDHDTNPDDTETVPVLVCQTLSAAYAQQHGVTRCTNEQCWPLNPDETPKDGIR